MTGSESSADDGLLVHLEYLAGLYPDLPLAHSRQSPVAEASPVTRTSPVKGDPGISLFPGGEEIRQEPGGEDRNSMNGESALIKLSGLSGIVASCRDCPLGESRTQAVFGEGDPKARLMFIGEGPGAEEDRTGRPFVGRAGELLTKMIGAMGLKREQVYIANAVKCRPPGNRTPELLERDACKHFLLDQIRIIRPGAIVLLGQTAIFSMLTQNSPISSVRGVESSLPDFPGIRVMPTYHPAYLLRNPQAKVLVWKDLQQVMSWLSLPLPADPGKK